MKHKLDFFTANGVQKHLFIYLLSLLDNQTRLKAKGVNEHWRQCAQLAQNYLELLPTIRRIPSFTEVGLDVLRLKLLAGGMTNRTYKLKLKTSSTQWVLRIPGQGSNAFITRKDEAHNAVCAERLGLNVPIAFFDPIDGLQLTQFIKGARPLDKKALDRRELLIKLAAMMRRLHSSNQVFTNDASIFKRNELLLENLKTKGFQLPNEIDFIETQMTELSLLVASYQIPNGPCHNDTTPLNFIRSLEYSEPQNEEQLYMIDWEYSSNNDFLWDLVYFCLEAKLSKQQEQTLLTAYFGETKITSSMLAWFEIYKPIIEWWITLWAWTQVANGANAVEINDYEQLGVQVYQKTLSFLNSQEYKQAFALIEEERNKASSTLVRRPF